MLLYIGLALDVDKGISYIGIRRRLSCVMAVIFGFYMHVVSAAEPAGEPSLHFEQELVQGTLVYGTTSAKFLDVLGRKVEVDEDGRFVFGIGRDIETPLVVRMIDGLGNEYPRSIDVRQRTYKTQSITGVASKYVSPPEEVLARIQSDNRRIKQARLHFSVSRYDYLSEFIWPAEGPVSGVYGSQRIFNGVPKRPHYGLDIAAPTGTPVVAPAAGEVRLVENDMYYSGGTLIIDHGRGVSSTFIHLSKLHVSEGQRVSQGEKIAEIGATGRVTGPHLDWRINWFDQRLDPALLLPERE